MSSDRDPILFHHKSNMAALTRDVLFKYYLKYLHTIKKREMRYYNNVESEFAEIV